MGSFQSSNSPVCECFVVNDQKVGGGGSQSKKFAMQIHSLLVSPTVGHSPIFYLYRGQGIIDNYTAYTTLVLKLWSSNQITS